MPSQKEPKRTAQTEPNKSKSKQGEPASRSSPAQSDTRHEPGRKTTPQSDEGKQR